MLGAIAGDVIGSVYEASPIKTTDFPLFDDYCRFTDDTVLTVAIAAAVLGNHDYRNSVRRYGLRYPNAGYGGSFFKWLLSSQAEPYHSWGNGAAMRVSPVGFAFNSIEDVLLEAKRSAAITHNHPEGIKGAQATALAVFLSRQGESKKAIRSELSRRFSYDLDRRLEDIRPYYHFDVSCQGSVPESIIAFLTSVDFEDAIRQAISLGGDSDTMACIAGGIAQAYYGKIPDSIAWGVRDKLPKEFLAIIDTFNETYDIST